MHSENPLRAGTLRAGAERPLIKLASGYEAAANVSRRPRFMKTFDVDTPARRLNTGGPRRNLRELLLRPQLRRQWYL